MKLIQSGRGLVPLRQEPTGAFVTGSEGRRSEAKSDEDGRREPTSSYQFAGSLMSWTEIQPGTVLQVGLAAVAAV